MRVYTESEGEAISQFRWAARRLLDLSPGGEGGPEWGHHVNWYCEKLRIVAETPGLEDVDTSDCALAIRAACRDNQCAEALRPHLEFLCPDALRKFWVNTAVAAVFGSMTQWELFRTALDEVEPHVLRCEIEGASVYRKWAASRGPTCAVKLAVLIHAGFIPPMPALDEE